jgi:hypothetical protein
MHSIQAKFLTLFLRHFEGKMPRRDGYHTLGGCFVGIRKLADGSPDGMVGMSKPCQYAGVFLP